MLIDSLGVIEDIENINENAMKYIDLVNQLVNSKLNCGNFIC